MKKELLLSISGIFYFWMKSKISNTPKFNLIIEINGKVPVHVMPRTTLITNSKVIYNMRSKGKFDKIEAGFPDCKEEFNKQFSLD